MAISSTTNALCQSLNKGYDGAITPVNKSKGSVQDLLREFESGLITLGNTGFSPDNVLDDAINSMRNDVSQYWPGNTLDDMNVIKQFLEECEYLSGLQPVAALLSSLLGLFDIIGNALGDLAATVPEFGLGNLASQLLDILRGLFPGGANISDLLARSDKLINCMDLLCSGSGGSGFIHFDTTIYSNEVQGLYSDMNLIDDPMDPNYGNPNFDSMYNDAGMDSAQKTKMNVVNAGIDGIKQDTMAAIESSIQSVKSITGIGGLF